MFNSAGFNKQRFNLPTATTEIFEFTVSMLADVGAAAYMSINMRLSASEAAEFGGSARVVPVIWDAESGVASFSAYAGVVWNIAEQNNGSAIFDSSASIGQNAYVTVNGAIHFDGNTEVGLNMPLVAAMAATVAAFGHVSMNFDMGQSDLLAVFDAFTKTTSFDVETIDINVSVGIGSTVTIDAGNYTIMLDGVNVIDNHSGAWLDELSRRIYEVRVSSNNSIPVETTIIFTPEYL